MHLKSSLSPEFLYKYFSINILYKYFSINIPLYFLYIGRYSSRQKDIASRHRQFKKVSNLLRLWESQISREIIIFLIKYDSSQIAVLIFTFGVLKEKWVRELFWRGTWEVSYRVESPCHAAMYRFNWFTWDSGLKRSIDSTNRYRAIIDHSRQKTWKLCVSCSVNYSSSIFCLIQCL